MKARMRGFTLIEVMVALVIVAFGMGAVLAALSAIGPFRLTVPVPVFVKLPRPIGRASPRRAI